MNRVPTRVILLKYGCDSSYPYTLMPQLKKRLSESNKLK